MLKQTLPLQQKQVELRLLKKIYLLFSWFDVAHHDPEFLSKGHRLIIAKIIPKIENIIEKIQKRIVTL